MVCQFRERWRIAPKGLRWVWPTIQTVAPDWLEAVIQTAMDADIREWWQPAGGAIADTYVVDLANSDGQRVVCKRDGASIWTGDVIEPLVATWVGERTDLPVPNVISKGSLSAGLESARWALYEFIDGTPPSLETPSERAWIATRAGSLLGRLHAAFAFDRRGGLARSDGELVIRPTDGVSILDSLLGHRFVSTAEASAPAVSPVLAHGDYRPANLLVRDKRVAAVLDWGNAHVTHPGFSLARAEVRFADLPASSASERTELRERFRSSYADHHSVPGTVMAELPRYKVLWVVQAAHNLVGVAQTPRGRVQLRRQLLEHVGANDI